jgi:hypothetical protein
MAIRQHVHCAMFGSGAREAHSPDRVLTVFCRAAASFGGAATSRSQPKRSHAATVDSDKNEPFATSDETPSQRLRDASRDSTRDGGRHLQSCENRVTAWSVSLSYSRLHAKYEDLISHDALFLSPLATDSAHVHVPLLSPSTIRENFSQSTAEIQVLPFSKLVPRKDEPSQFVDRHYA